MSHGRSVTCGCVPGQNTLPLIARVFFSDRTLKIVGPFYLVSMPGPGDVKDPTRVIYNVTRSGLTNPSISWRHWLCLWASCVHHRLRDTNMGARPLRYYAVGCLTTSRCSVLKTSSVLTLYLGQFTRYWPISIQYRRQIYVSPFTRCVSKVSRAENVSGSC